MYNRVTNTLWKGKYLQLRNNRRPHRHIVLGHQYLDAHSASSVDVWRSLNRLESRVRSWMKYAKRVYAVGGMVSFEIERARDTDGTKSHFVHVHAHALIEPRLGRHSDIQNRIARSLPAKWEKTAKVGESSIFETRKYDSYGNPSLLNRMRYLNGVIRYQSKMLDGLLSPFKFQKQAYKRWTAKGSTDAQQLMLMLAAYTWRDPEKELKLGHRAKRRVRCYGDWLGDGSE